MFRSRLVHGTFLEVGELTDRDGYKKWELVLSIEMMLPCFISMHGSIEMKH